MTSLLNRDHEPSEHGCSHCDPAAKPRCVCQACHDGHHKCIHDRTPRTESRPKDYGITTYMAHFCVERPYKPRPKSFKPVPRDPLDCDRTEAETTYQCHYRIQVPNNDDPYTVKLQKYPPPKIPMEQKSVYMDDYTEASCYHNSLRFWRKQKKMDYEAYLKAQKNPLSRPQRPPRPYDYSKCDTVVARGPLLHPTTMLPAKEEDRVKVVMPKYLSDGAPSSYVTGTTFKDAYDADVEIREIPCCRPEAHYHPDRLQTCIACREARGHVKTCPVWLYGQPDKPLKDAPDIGPTPALKECSTYQSAYRTPQKYSFLIPDAPCRRRTTAPPEPCTRLARNLPIPVGYQLCNRRQDECV